MKILALIESAKAVMSLKEICNSSSFLDGLLFAGEDFATDLSLTRSPSLSEFLYARSAIVTASKAYGLQSTIDLVQTDFKGDGAKNRLETESIEGKGFGFNGKQCIHPSQVEVVQRAFSPNQKEVEWAARVIVADKKARNLGKGAWSLDGKMIDIPIVKKCTDILATAKECDYNISELLEEWKAQDPQ